LDATYVRDENGFAVATWRDTYGNFRAIVIRASNFHGGLHK
jgi:hypothetical protein